MQHVKLTSGKFLFMYCMIITAIADMTTVDSAMFIWMPSEGASLLLQSAEALVLQVTAAAIPLTGSFPECVMHLACMARGMHCTRHARHSLAVSRGSKRQKQPRKPMESIESTSYALLIVSFMTKFLAVHF